MQPPFSLGLGHGRPCPLKDGSVFGGLWGIIG